MVALFGVFAYPWIKKTHLTATWGSGNEIIYVVMKFGGGQAEEGLRETPWGT